MAQPFMSEEPWILLEEQPRFEDDPMERVIHVMPIHDYDEHELSFKCWCNPYLDYKNKDTGDELVIHRMCREDKHS